MYERFVDGWAQAFAGASDAPPAEHLRELALLGHTLVYGLPSTAFIGERARAVDTAQLNRRTRDAVAACLCVRAQAHAVDGAPRP